MAGYFSPAYMHGAIFIGVRRVFTEHCAWDTPDMHVFAGWLRHRDPYLISDRRCAALLGPQLSLVSTTLEYEYATLSRIKQRILERNYCTNFAVRLYGDISEVWDFEQK